ncbi:MAG: hypothetical protein ACJATI_005252 [Halioglobus sp.]|jgi:hypothetical protein
MNWIEVYNRLFEAINVREDARHIFLALDSLVH